MLVSELIPHLDAMLLHPVVIDGAFQSAGVARNQQYRDIVFVPSVLKEITLVRNPTAPKGVLHLKYQRAASNAEQHVFDIDIYDCYSQLAVEIRGYTIRDLRGNPT